MGNCKEPTSRLIHLRDVSKSYVEGEVCRCILNKATVQFDNNKFIVVRGRSGSGKSTLLNLLAGVDVPDSGSIEILDCNLSNCTEYERTMFRRKNIGFVFQSYHLIPSLSVYENLMFPLDLNNCTFNKKDRIAEVLTSFGLIERLYSYPDVLSGGEQQRIAIARALVHKPKIVLADEPTGNLDDKNESGVLKLLAGLPKQFDTTVICVTHSDAVSKYADAIYTLSNGEIEKLAMHE